jgi:hypothetical protein
LTARAKAVYAKRLESTERALTQQDSTDSAAEDTPRRFHVELFIKHPAIDPADISAALGLEAHSAQRVGDPRTTPKGTPVSGNYWDTRWRHCVECSVPDQWYAAEVTRLLDRLEPHKAFFANLKSTGGNACVIIHFFSDGYLSDEIPHATLAKLVELGLDLGIECVSQTDNHDHRWRRETPRRTTQKEDHPLLGSIWVSDQRADDRFGSIGDKKPGAEC